MTDDIVTLDNRGIRRLERQFRELGETVLASALSGALNDIALDANRRMALAFERTIEGGPEAFTKINPGQRKSSVVERPGRPVAGADHVQSATAVQALQSTYLKYGLGERRERRPGDVGLADKTLFVPIEENLRKYQGIDLKRGNLPKGAVKKLLKRVADTDKPAKRDRNGRPKPKKLKFGEVFYGQTRPGSPTGFWMRPSAEKTGSDRRPKLLLMAEDKQSTPGFLVPAWNRSVVEAAQGLDAAYEARLQAILDARRVTP